MLGIILGAMTIALGAKAFTPVGLPPSKTKNLTGRSGKAVGAFCLLLGTLFIVDGVFAAIGLRSFVATATNWLGALGNPRLDVGPSSEPSSKPVPAMSPLPADAPESLTNSLGMTLKLIPPGDFLMSALFSDPDAEMNEHYEHTVRITRAFYVRVSRIWYRSNMHY